tara:strand:- start:4853 stop:5536 length:684 start_codon:yes stop_codon:yes gene_type:complete
MQSLNDILKDKRVVLVGPAPYLADQKRGKIIEDYDIVCGLGSLFNLKNEDYGNRIDILFNTANCHWGRDWNKNNFISKNIKYFVGTNKRNKTINSQAFTSFCDKIKEVSKKKVEFYDLSDYTTLLESKCCNCSIQQARQHDGLHTGSFVISYLLSLPIKELRIEGMTFYNSGKFGYGHNKDYHLDKHYFLTYNSHPALSIKDEMIFVKNIIKQSKIPVSYDNNYFKI